MNLSEIGPKLKERREYLGFTPAEVMRYLGSVDQYLIEGFESGENKLLTLENIEKLCKLYHITFEDLMSPPLVILPEDLVQQIESNSLTENDLEEILKFTTYLKGIENFDKETK